MKITLPKFVEAKIMRLISIACCLLMSAVVSADSLDTGVAEDSFLHKVSAALSAYEIDVTSNLNAREVIRQRIARPRLGRFPDLPIDSLPDSEEITNWEREYLAADIGGLAIIANEDSFEGVDESVDESVDEGVNKGVNKSSFLSYWLSSSAQRRLFITYYYADFPAAEKLERVVNAQGFATQLHYAKASAKTKAKAVGNLYATAAQRLAIDTRAARRYRTEVTELAYLGDRVRRNSNSLFSADGNKGNGSLARREPAVFLKETLGDEFNQSTISEIVVPGGVALGETAVIEWQIQELVFREEELQLLDENQSVWRLPTIAPADVKALFDFVERSESIRSDAIVDIDEDGRVRISSALRDTDVGFEIVQADTQPFQFVPNLPVSKSVVIDSHVSWYRKPTDNELQFATAYEVRFLSADNMRIAQTRVALAYQYQSEDKSSVYKEGWGRDLRRLDNNLDYSGLGNSMLEVAEYAGWIALFRRLQEDAVPFLQGRYDFMKIDKAGKSTPARY